MMLAALVLLAGLAGTEPQGADSAFAARIRDHLATGSLPGLRWHSLGDVRVVAESAYRRAGWRPLWLEAGRPTAAARATVAAIAAVATRGLDPADFDADTLAAWAGRLERRPEEGPRFDLAMTTATLRLVTALRLGRVSPAVAVPGWRFGPGRFDPLPYLDSLRAGAVGALDAAEPAEAEYQALKAWLARIRAERPPPPVRLPRPGRTLRAGDSFPGAGALRALLITLGDLPAGATGPDSVYDDGLAAGVRRFQARHGLTDDGVVGPATVAALNVPPQARVRPIELALERRRWWPDAAHRPDLVVNVAAFSLTAPADSSVRMKVITGQAKKNETPVFSALLGAVTFQPWWEIPASIMRKETKPAALRDPGYLEAEGMELWAGEDVVPATAENVARIGRDVRVRQRPGPKNALGRVKFQLESPYSVHLHDTPTPRLFEAARRDFSHGCIRVSDPAALAGFALRSVAGWTGERIAAALAADSTETIAIPRPLSVAVVYEPVSVTGRGIEFRPDLYRRDRVLDSLMRQPPPRRDR